ncbi:MAG: hypothetical protein KY468_19795, partial [Armatimonadetes bacterium]|nr:hypothetical protein [Armatimonadota bacterium]
MFRRLPRFARVTPFVSLLLFAAPVLAQSDGLPSPWREVPAAGGWQVSGDADSRALASTTRVAGASTVVIPFPATDQPVEVSFTALAPAIPGHRGLNFGLGWSQPEKDAYRASLLTFGGAGQVIFWDPGGWFNVGAYRQGQPTRIRLITAPSL